MADSDIKLRFAVEGDQTLQSALRAIDAEIKSLNEGFKASTAEMKNFDDAEKDTKGASDQLNGIIAANQEKLKLLAGEYENAKAKLATLAKEMEEAKKSGDPAAIEKATKAYNDQSVTVSKLETEMNKSKAAIANAKNEMSGLSGVMDLTKQGVEKLSGGFTVMKGVIANLATDAIRNLGSALKGAIGSIAGIGTSFESSMAQVKAISGATAEEFAALKDKAEEMGRNTKFTATQAGDAMNYMAMAGWKASDMIDGIGGILDLAAASGEDLATTSDIVTDALTAMGYAAKDSGHLADVMAATAANANTNVSMMGETFKYAAPVAGTLGYSMEDLAAAIGLMANSGIKGSQAGTSLRSILTRLAAPPKAAKEAMEQYGISLTDSTGKMKPMRVLLDEMREKFKGMSETEATAAANALAGKNAMSGFLAVVRSSDEDFAKMLAAVDNSTGAAKEMSDIMQDTVEGAMTRLGSASEGVANAIYNAFSGTAKEAIDLLAEYVRYLGESLKNWSGTEQAQAMLERLAASVMTVVQTLGNNLEPIITGVIMALEGFATAVTFVAENFDAIVKGIQIAIGAFVAMKATIAAVNLVSILANPVGLVIVAIGALIATIVLLITNFDRVKQGAILIWGDIQRVWGKAAGWFKGVVSGIVGAFSGFIGGVVQFFVDGWKGVVSAWDGAVNYFNELATGIVKAITDEITSLPEKALNWAKDMMEGFGKGITQFMDAVTQPVKNLADKIASFLHFSRPDVGPLRNYETWMPDMVKGLSASLRKATPMIELAAGHAANAIYRKIGNIETSATVSLMADGGAMNNMALADSIAAALESSGAIGKGGFTVNQTVNANQTSYAAQQREAAFQIGNIARRLGYV